ncbi:MAG: NAD(P)/FAD-dependent oxidoreductase [Pseudomonadota bacterium]
MEIKCGNKVEAIVGGEQVNAVDLLDLQSGKRNSLQVDGVLVHIGVEPNTAYFRGFVPLDSRSQILVNEQRETQIPGVFAAGDIRHHSPMQITTAVGDGAMAALSVARFLSLRAGDHA